MENAEPHMYGMALLPNRKYHQNVTGSLHISGLALDKGDFMKLYMIARRCRFIIATLTDQTPQIPLDMNFGDGERLTFYAVGNGRLSMLGYSLQKQPKIRSEPYDDNGLGMGNFIDDSNMDNSGNDNRSLEYEESENKSLRIANILHETSGFVIDEEPQTGNDTSDEVKAIDNATEANVCNDAAEDIPNDYNPGGFKPDDYNPDDYNPGGFKPDDYNPDDYNPGGFKPDDYNPDDYNPGGFKPDDYNPGGFKPDDYNPGGFKPDDYNPDDYNPGGFKPDDYNHDDYNPGGFKPDDYNPGGFKPDDYNPDDYNPGGFKPDDYNPGGFKPDDYNPGDFKPDDYSPGGFKPDDYNPDDYNPCGFKPDNYSPDDYKSDDYNPDDYKPEDYNPDNYNSGNHESPRSCSSSDFYKTNEQYNSEFYNNYDMYNNTEDQTNGSPSSNRSIDNHENNNDFDFNNGTQYRSNDSEYLGGYGLINNDDEDSMQWYSPSQDNFMGEPAYESNTLPMSSIDEINMGYDVNPYGADVASSSRVVGDNNNKKLKRKKKDKKHRKDKKKNKKAKDHKKKKNRSAAANSIDELPDTSDDLQSANQPPAKRARHNSNAYFNASFY